MDVTPLGRRTGPIMFAAAPIRPIALQAGKDPGVSPSLPRRGLAWFALGAGGVVLLGLVWRLTRYALCFPIWGDEAMLCLNLAERDLAGMTRPLAFGQVAPLLFVVGEWCACHAVGSSEWALRLLPLVASLLSLPLFWMLARTLLPERAALLAVAILAVSIWPATMGSLVKPYSGDLFWSLLLLVPAARLLGRDRVGDWVCLIAATPLAILASFPACFIGGAVALALLVPVDPLRRGRLHWVCLGLYVVVLTGAFAANHALVIARTDAGTRAYMESYWRAGFPPAEIPALCLWLVKAHCGQMLAYPLGAANGGSILTAALTLTGVVALCRAGAWRTLVLCLSGFALSLVAACLRAYPYGDSCRLAQHLAPAVCLLTAAGVEHVCECMREEGRRRLAWGAVLCLLASVGVAGIARDLLRPYRGAGDLWTREVLREVFRKVQAGDHVLLTGAPERLDSTFRWYLLQQHAPVRFLAEVDLENLATLGGSVWCLDAGFSFDPAWRPAPSADVALLARSLESGDCGKLHSCHHYLFVEGGTKRPLTQYCDVHRWSGETTRPLLASSAGR